MTCVAVFAALAAAAQPAAAQIVNEERAIRNYVALMKGMRQLHQLTPIERREVAEVARLIREGGELKGNDRESCIDQEIQASGGSVTYLESRIIDLKCSQR